MSKMIDHRMQGLSTFVRVVEAGSFTAGARLIGTTPSAVSKNIARLERQLGTRLFQRSTRAFGLTPEGRAYFDRIAPLVRAIEDASEALGPQPRAAGRLRISLPTHFGRFVLEALTMQFYREHPEVQLDISMTDGHVDLIREGYDAAIRIGRLADTALIARPLGSLPMVLVAAPSYLAKHGVPDSVDALSDHAHIRYMLGGRPFPIRFESGELIMPLSAFDTDSGEAMRIAARNGLGIAQLLQASIQDELAIGSLIPVLAGHRLPPAPVQILHAFARAVPARAAVLFKFLDSEMARWR